MMIGSSRARGLIGVMSAALVLTIVSSVPEASPTVAAPAPTTSAAEARATLDRYCVSCHSDRLKTGGLSLQGFDLSAVAEHSDTLEKVVRKLRLGSMPP